MDVRTSGPDPGPWTPTLDPKIGARSSAREPPPHQRVPIVLFHFDDLSYQEIAERLGVSVGKVKTDIHRGREALRAVLSRLNPRGVAR